MPNSIGPVADLATTRPALAPFLPPQTAMQQAVHVRPELLQRMDRRDAIEVQRIARMNRRDCKVFFWELPAPDMNLVDGEYDGQLLTQGNALENAMTRKAFGRYGRWLGKAFTPTGPDTGRGYNLFGDPADPIRKLPMTTCVRPSRLVTFDSMAIEYPRRGSGLLHWMVGELRQFTPGVLLGLGNFGPTGERYRQVRRVMPFLLVHSGRPYQEGNRPPRPEA